MFFLPWPEQEVCGEVLAYPQMPIQGLEGAEFPLLAFAACKSACLGQALQPALCWDGEGQLFSPDILLSSTSFQCDGYSNTICFNKFCIQLPFHNNMIFPYNPHVPILYDDIIRTYIFFQNFGH